MNLIVSVTVKTYFPKSFQPVQLCCTSLSPVFFTLQTLKLIAKNSSLIKAGYLLVHLWLLTCIIDNSVHACLVVACVFINAYQTCVFMHVQRSKPIVQHPQAERNHAAGRVTCTSLMELRVFSRHSSELSSKVQWTYVSLSYEPRINNL